MELKTCEGTGAFVDTASKPPLWHKFHGEGGGAVFHGINNIWDTLCPAGHTLLRLHVTASNSTCMPVSQWPTTTRWQQTDEQTN